MKNPFHLIAQKLKPSDDAAAIANGFHDLAAAIREFTASTQADEPGATVEPNRYLDGKPV